MPKRTKSRKVGAALGTTLIALLFGDIKESEYWILNKGIALMYKSIVYYLVVISYYFLSAAENIDNLRLTFI